jgi:outer membrane receptor protein involved in Fe transport
MKKVFAILVFAALLGGGLAWAQETTGAIIGAITSEDGATMPGVTVTITDPATGFERTTVTSTSGEFRFSALQPAKYGLQATLDGFQTYKRDINVELGRTVKNDFVMTLGAITDVIEVTGEAPLVDVTSTVTGLTVGAAELDSQIPLVHDTQRIALLAPSTTMGDTAFNGANDGTYDQQLVSVGGSSVGENSYQINGLNITNFRNGVGSTWVPFEFVDEVQVKTGGYEAEFGRSTGGVVNMVTKSGTNAFHGGASLFYEPDSLQEQEPDTVYAYNQQEETDYLEGNASIGGPIFKDKLFFFGFLQYRDTDYLLNTTSTATREEGSTPYYGGKLDWNITPNHRLEATYLTDETTIDQTLHPIVDGVIQFDTVNSTGERTRGGENYIGKYTGIFSENFLLSAQYGFNAFDRTDQASGDAYPYAYSYLTGTQVRIGYWTNYQRGQAADEREAYRIDADLFLGNHSFRAGIDDENNWSEDFSGYAGGYRSIYYLNGTRFPDLPADQILVDYRIYEAAGDFDVYSNAAYLQDSWAVTPNLTLNLGVRWEMYENKNVNGETFIKIDDQYAPRLGAIWDPSGSGKSKVFASFGLYHLPIASNTNIRMAGTELYTGDWFTADGYNPDGSPINMGTTPLAPQRVYADGLVPDVRQVISENLDPMAQQEMILGYEQMAGANWSLGARFVAREFQSVIEDVGADWALYYLEGISTGWWGLLANPGSGVSAWFDGLPMDEPDGILEHYSWTAEEMGYPEAERKYYAVELTAKKRFANNWTADFMYTWSQSYGNYEGYVDSTIGQSDAGITQLFDYPGLADNSYGPLPNDRRHNFKAFGVYSFDFGMQLGGSLWYQSGRPLSCQGVHPTDAWAASYLVASFYCGGEAVPRGSVGTTDDAYALDLMAKYDFNLGSTDWYVRLDLFNLTDADAVTEVDEEGDQDTGDPNENFLAPTHYQPPRSVRFGVGITF